MTSNHRIDLSIAVKELDEELGQAMGKMLAGVKMDKNPDLEPISVRILKEGKCPLFAGYQNEGFVP
jgi:hypothetical protein